MAKVYVTMLIDVQGPRDGVEWPQKGEIALVEDWEAYALIDSESARYYGPGPEEVQPIESATVEERGETATVEIAPKRRGRPPSAENASQAARKSITKQ